MIERMSDYIYIYQPRQNLPHIPFSLILRYIIVLVPHFIVGMIQLKAQSDQSDTIHALKYIKSFSSVCSIVSVIKKEFRLFAIHHFTCMWHALIKKISK